MITKAAPPIEALSESDGRGEVLAVHVRLAERFIETGDQAPFRCKSILAGPDAWWRFHDILRRPELC